MLSDCNVLMTFNPYSKDTKYWHIVFINLFIPFSQKGFETEITNEVTEFKVLLSREVK